MSLKERLEQGQDKLCPNCRKGQHEKCLRPKAGFFCCCDGEPNRQTSSESLASKGLKATVPKGIIDYLRLENGDILDWRMDFKNGKRFVNVSKSESKKPKGSAATPSKEAASAPTTPLNQGDGLND